MQRAEALLRRFIPGINLTDPNFDAQLSEIAPLDVDPISDRSQGISAPRQSGDNSQKASDQDAHLRSMIESTGQLDLDDRGHWAFHGGSSGTVFLKRMREQFGGLLGSDTNTPLLPRPMRPSGAVPQIFDSPKSANDSPLENGLPNTLDLPSREHARELISNALNKACALLRFVHQPTFYELFDRIYDVPVENYGNDENKFLPLLYVVLALGSMFEIGHGMDVEDNDQVMYKGAIDQGYVTRLSRGIDSANLRYP